MDSSGGRSVLGTLDSGTDLHRGSLSLSHTVVDRPRTAQLLSGAVKG
ncbi:hypothetical protein KPATCC21470_2239 [Kitasatospora purpeofusca]